MALPGEARRGPTDWSDWEQYRSSVVHPAGCIQRDDIERARQNLQQFDWARRFVEGQKRSMADVLEKLTPEYLEMMLPVTSPGCSGACPACIEKDLPWHPTGQWVWSSATPNQLTCKVCETVFPNEAYPESIAIRSTFDPRQVITYCKSTVYKCHGYAQARPSPSSTIRARKVNYMAGQLETLGRLYVLTEDLAYARAARDILLRLAEVFPTYMVASGYGYLEYADCDPHIAAQRISNLPTDEICAPPNKPDRSLHTGYWSASRNGSWGHEGGWGMKVAEAYDLTCTAQGQDGPVFSEEEKRRIERDVLLESTVLCVNEPRLNNKSIRGRCAAAVIGSIVGHPGLVHWGVEEFCNAVDGGWFLPDGGASECSSYAIVVMDAVRSIMTVFRDYSDPAGYVNGEGDRLDHWNACRDTRFGDCWQALVWSLQGDLTFPPLADTFVGAQIPVVLSELLAACYPRHPYPSYLKERLGGALGNTGWWSLFYRDPHLAEAALDALALPDVVFPFMQQGYLRTGPRGRQSALVLNASAWGGHHHADSLNLYYWQDGQELLSDLGYLWDHPEKRNLHRTFAHNLAMIDGEEQRHGGRGGQFHLFSTTPRVKIMEASSAAYAQATQYRRTCVQITHGDQESYVLDLFRVGGGNQHDYVFHGPNREMQVSHLDLQVATPQDSTADGPVQDLQNLRTAPGEASWSATWSLSDDRAFSAWSAGGDGHTVLIGDGWGQRNPHNKDRGALLPYLIRRTAGSDDSVFVSVFEGHGTGSPVVLGVTRLELPESAPAGSVAVAVETAHGVDVIVSQVDPVSLAVNTPWGRLESDARLAAVTHTPSGSRTLTLVEGHTLRLGDRALRQQDAAWEGQIVDARSDAGNSCFVLDAALPSVEALAGATLFVSADDGVQRAYPIRTADIVDGRTRIHTKIDQVGFEATPAKTWRLPLVTSLSLEE